MAENVTGRKIERAAVVCRRICKSRVQLWRDVRAGTFPAPIRLGPNAIGFFSDEVDAWLASRPRQTYRADEAAA